MSVKCGIDYYTLILSSGETSITANDRRYMVNAAQTGHIRAINDGDTQSTSFREARVKLLKVIHHVTGMPSRPADFPTREALVDILLTGRLQIYSMTNTSIVSLCIQTTRWFSMESDAARYVRQAIGYLIHGLTGAILYAREIDYRMNSVANLGNWVQSSTDEEEDSSDDVERDDFDEDSDHDSDEDGLLNYSANPFDFHPWDKRNADNALVFGVELEMEATAAVGHSSHTLVRKLGGSRGGKRSGHFILKSDGSLTNGVELVTMPFTLDQHKDPEGKMPWAKVLAPLLAKNMAMSGAGTTHCGIHIHINKKSLSALTIGKMLVFLNSETLAPLVSLIAQRASSNYCKRDGKKKIIDGGAQRGSDRYDIMNISVNHPTCEIRMFRGNLRPERILKNIEFCHALVQYCRQTSMQDLTDWGNFTRWLLTHRGVYDNLVQFLIDKNAVGFRQEKRESNEFHTYAELEEV